MSVVYDHYRKIVDRLPSQTQVVFNVGYMCKIVALGLAGISIIHTTKCGQCVTGLPPSEVLLTEENTTSDLSLVPFVLASVAAALYKLGSSIHQHSNNVNITEKDPDGFILVTVEDVFD